MNTSNATIARLISLLNQVLYANNEDSRELLSDSLARQIAAEVGQLETEVRELRAALEVIADIDPNNPIDNGGEGFNEWGEAVCFNRAQAAARAALAKVPK